MIPPNEQRHVRDIRINVMAFIAWHAHASYPAPLPSPGNYPGTSAERWRWFGGSSTEPPAWIYITDGELAKTQKVSWWEAIMRKLFVEDHHFHD